MNKKNIIEYLMSKRERVNFREEDEIMKAIEDTKVELECARSVFENVSDSKLVEIAIFSEEVAKRRYEYLLDMAKKKGLRVSNEYMLDRCVKVVQ